MVGCTLKAKELDFWWRGLFFIARVFDDAQEQFEAVGAAARAEWARGESPILLEDWSAWYSMPARFHGPISCSVILACAPGASLRLVIPDWFSGEWSRRFAESSRSLLTGASISLNANLRAQSLYGRSINSLLNEVRRGDERALLDCVGLDPVVLGTKPARKLLATSVLAGDRRFLEKIAQKISRPPASVQERDLGYLDAGLMLMRASGSLNRLSGDDCYELFVKRLRWYRDGPDARDNLWKKVRRFKAREGGQ